jgi:hypothetical protein
MMDLVSADSPVSTTTPSKKKSSETHSKSKAELILEKSPSSIKALREKHRFTATSPKGESHTRPSGPTPTKSPSTLKSVAKDDNSDDEEAAFERLRAQDALEAENLKSVAKPVKQVDKSDSDSDNDAPVAKSFKETKKEVIEQQHGELDDVRAVSAKQKDMRRQRTQLLQDQSKKLASKKKFKERKAKEAEQMDVDEEIDLLPESVLQRALSQTHTTQVMEQDVDERSKIERRKMKQLERERERNAKIENKRVTVISLSDLHGNPQLQSRKASAQSAEAFLKDHFWGGRLERIPAEHYLSERIRGPALQFIVSTGSSMDDLHNMKGSMKNQRRSVQQKRKQK